MYSEEGFDDFILQKIGSYILCDLLTHNFHITKYTIKNLSSLNRRFHKNFNNTVIHKYLSNHISEISFWPYQRSISYDMLQPVRHDLDMINYILTWKSCSGCKSTLLYLLVNTNKIIDPFSKTTFLKDNFHLLFCPTHFNDIHKRGKLEFWNKVVLELIPEPNPQKYNPTPKKYCTKLQIIVDKCPRWC